MKKTLALLLALVMCLSLVGCGENEVDINEATNDKTYCTVKDVLDKMEHPRALWVTFNSGEYSTYRSSAKDGKFTVESDSIGWGDFVIDGNTIVLDDGQMVLTYDPKEQTFSSEDGLILYYVDEESKQNTTAPDASTTAEATESEQVWGWSVEPVLDDFGDPTGEYCLCGLFPGKFSNSSTTDAELVARIYYYIDWWDNGSTEKLIFNMLEYGSQEAYFSTREDIEIKLKQPSGSVYSSDEYGFLMLDDDNRSNPYFRQRRLLDGRVSGDIFDFDAFISFFLIGVEYKGEDSYILKAGNSKYEFTITNTGWEESLTELLDTHDISYDFWMSRERAK